MLDQAIRFLALYRSHRPVIVPGYCNNILLSLFLSIACFISFSHKFERFHGWSMPLMSKIKSKCKYCEWIFIFEAQTKKSWVRYINYNLFEVTIASNFYWAIHNEHFALFLRLCVCLHCTPKQVDMVRNVITNALTLSVVHALNKIIP